MNILIVDDHKLFRQGLEALFFRESGFMIVGEAANGYEAIRLTDDLEPDIILMDINMPDMNGIEATRHILEKHPAIKVIAITMCTDRRAAQEMLRAGASGYIHKTSSFEEVLEALRVVAANRRYIAQSTTELLLDDYIGNLDGVLTSEKNALTNREREILQLIAEGRTTKEIAEKLCVTTNTVDTHRKHVSDRLGLHSIAELTRYAISRGIVPLD